MPAVGVADVGPKRGDFNLERSARCGIVGNLLKDDNDPELRAPREAVREKLLDAVGRSVGCDVEIGGLAFEQDVAHTSADEIGLMARYAQRAANLFREFTSVHSDNYVQKAAALLRGDAKHQTRDVVMLARGAAKGIPPRHDSFQHRFRAFIRRGFDGSQETR